MCNFPCVNCLSARVPRYFRHQPSTFLRNQEHFLSLSLQCSDFFLGCRDIWLSAYPLPEVLKIPMITSFLLSWENLTPVSHCPVLILMPLENQCLKCTGVLSVLTLTRLFSPEKQEKQVMLVGERVGVQSGYWTAFLLGFLGPQTRLCVEELLHRVLVPQENLLNTSMPMCSVSSYPGHQPSSLLVN